MIRHSQVGASIDYKVSSSDVRCSRTSEVDTSVRDVFNKAQSEARNSVDSFFSFFLGLSGRTSSFRSIFIVSGVKTHKASKSFGTSNSTRYNSYNSDSMRSPFTCKYFGHGINCCFS